MNNHNDPWNTDYGDDPDWYINQYGHRYKAKTKAPISGPLRSGVPVVDYLNTRDWERRNGPKPVTRQEKSHARFDRFWDGIVTSLVLAMCAIALAGTLAIGGFLEIPEKFTGNKPAVPVTVDQTDKACQP